MLTYGSVRGRRATGVPTPFGSVLAPKPHYGPEAAPAARGVAFRLKMATLRQTARNSHFPGRRKPISGRPTCRRIVRRSNLTNKTICVHNGLVPNGTLSCVQ